MHMPGKLRYRLLVLWLASVALTLLVVAASFHVLLTGQHEREARLQIGHAFGTLAGRMAELEARLVWNADLLAARPDLIASLHLVNRYQDPAAYQPYLFDVEKERLLKEIGQQARAARIQFMAAYDGAGNLLAFHVEKDGAELAGFESFQAGRAVFLAPGDRRPVAPPHHLLAAPDEAQETVEHVAQDGVLLVRRVVPVRRGGPGTALEGTVVAGYVLDPALVGQLVQQGGLRFVLVTGDAGHASAFGVDLGESAASLPMLGQAEAADERSWRLPHPEVFLGAMRLPLSGGSWAFLVLAADKTRLEAGLLVFQRATLIGILAIAGVLLPFGLVALRRTVSDPVERLTGAVRAVRDGRFERVQWKGPAGELAELAEAVDAMAGKIRERTRELEGTVDELSRSNAELQQFAHAAAHDLKEPVRLVVSYAQLLERRLGPRLEAEEREFMDYLVTAARRMHVLVDDLLAHSQAGLQELAFEPVDTAAVLRMVLETLQKPIEAAGAAVEVGALPTLAANGVQLQQVFQNLIGNALKFVPAGRTPLVRVEATRLPGEWLFTVADNGIGIEPQYLERIFNVFQRLHTQDRYPGTGMGLAICRRVIERHGGRIWAESTPGEGSRFRFTLPTAPAPAAQPAGAAQPV